MIEIIFAVLAYIAACWFFSDSWEAILKLSGLKEGDK